MATVDSPSTVTPDDGRANSLGIVPADGRIGALRATLIVATRALKKFGRTPQLIVLGTVEGALFLLFYRYVFGGAMDAGGVSGIDYVDYLIPGFIAVSALFTGLGGAAGVAEDVQHGFFDRLRSLPVTRVALPAGRVLADTVLVAWSSVMMTVVGFLVGFRLGGSIAEGLTAFGLVVVYGFAFTWLFVWLGLIAGNAQAAQGLSMIAFVLMFLSSAYVPIRTMPGWLQPFAENQPATIMTNAVRSLVIDDPAALGLNHGTTYWVTVSLLWCVGLVLVFAPLTVLRCRAS